MTDPSVSVGCASEGVHLVEVAGFSDLSTFSHYPDRQSVWKPLAGFFALGLGCRKYLNSDEWPYLYLQTTLALLCDAHWFLVWGTSYAVLGAGPLLQRDSSVPIHSWAAQAEQYRQTGQGTSCFLRVTLGDLALTPAPVTELEGRPGWPQVAGDWLFTLISNVVCFRPADSDHRGQLINSFVHWWPFLSLPLPIFIRLRVSVLSMVDVFAFYPNWKSAYINVQLEQRAHIMIHLTVKHLLSVLLSYPGKSW